MSSPYKKVAFYTLGCKLNFSETSTIARDFVSAGYSTVNFADDADVYVINTCSVTDNADSKTNRLIRKIKKKSPDSYIAIIGCYAQLKTEQISEIPGVDIVIGAGDKFNLPKYLDKYYETKEVVFSKSNINDINQFIPSYSIDERTRSFIKVQDGCDYSCSFCTIPLARGKSRSGRITDILDSINDICQSGIKEIVLSGINVGDFGVYNGESLFSLLNEIELMEDLHRCRISSIEPNLLSDEIIDLIAKSNKILPHFHIPLQSGSDRILKLMKRRYNVELYIEKIKKIKETIPDCCIGVDVIVGFPSENQEDFLNTYNLLEELDITYLHVFSYSERENTKALLIDEKIPSDIKQDRRKILTLLSDSKKKEFSKKNLNNDFNVLFESYEDGYVSGLTENYIKVFVKGNKELVNSIQKVRLTNYKDQMVFGELIH